MTRKDIFPHICEYYGISDRALQKIRNENPMRVEDMIKSFLCFELNISTSALINLYTKKASLENLEDIYDASSAIKKLFKPSAQSHPLMQIFLESSVEDLVEELSKKLKFYTDGKFIRAYSYYNNRDLSLGENFRPSSVNVFVGDMRVGSIDSIFSNEVFIDTIEVQLIDEENFKLKSADEILQECIPFFEVHDVKYVSQKKSIEETFTASIKKDNKSQNYFIAVKPENTETNIEYRIGKVGQDGEDESFAYIDNESIDILDIKGVLRLIEKYSFAECQVSKNIVNRFKIVDDEDNDFSTSIKYGLYMRLCKKISSCIFFCDFAKDASSLIGKPKIDIDFIKDEWYQEAKEKTRNVLKSENDKLKFTIVANIFPDDSMEIVSVKNIEVI